MTGNDSTVIRATSMRAYFHEALLTASRRQDVSINDDTAAYVINLLTAYCRANALTPVSDEGRYHKALATIYAEAVDADTPEQRNQGLQRLGRPRVVAPLEGVRVGRERIGPETCGAHHEHGIGTDGFAHGGGTGTGRQEPHGTPAAAQAMDAPG